MTTPHPDFEHAFASQANLIRLGLYTTHTQPIQPITSPARIPESHITSTCTVRTDSSNHMISLSCYLAPHSALAPFNIKDPGPSCLLHSTRPPSTALLLPPQPFYSLHNPSTPSNSSTLQSFHPLPLFCSLQQLFFAIPLRTLSATLPLSTTLLLSEYMFQLDRKLHLRRQVRFCALPSVLLT